MTVQWPSDSRAPPYANFQAEAQQELFDLIKQTRERQFETRVKPTPIFVITCDRISVLIAALLSYFKILKGPITIVIHDNFSTFGPTRMFLKRLEQEGIPVYWNSRNPKTHHDLSNVRSTIDHWYTLHDASHYVVTDPDIEFEPGSEDILDALAFLLQKYPFIDAVGPMLRRDDLPDHYPLKRLVHKQQEDLYRPEKQWPLLWNKRVLLVQSGWIDTAFAMYRKRFSFRRLNRSLQLHAPFTARHADWYLDPSKMEPDQVFYKQKNSAVGHWSSSWLPANVGGAKLPTPR